MTWPHEDDYLDTLMLRLPHPARHAKRVFSCPALWAWTTTEPQRYAQRMTTAAPANWYPDPNSDQKMRYWDGAAWTDQYADREPVRAPGWYPTADGGQREWTGTAWGKYMKPAHAAKMRPVKAAKVHVTREQKALAVQHAAWETQTGYLSALVDRARTFQPSTRSDLVLQKDEGEYISFTGSLVEDRAGQRQFVAGHAGVSIPIGSIHGHAVRYNYGRVKGHSIAVPPVATVIDTGRIYVTSNRIVFVGVKQTRESLFSKLVSIQHIGPKDTVVSVSNRQKPTRLQYDADIQGPLQFSLDLAQADMKGTRAGFIAELESQLEEETAAEPKAIL